MNIPTPAAVKKLTEDRKEREAELASSLANAKDKMPSTKAPKGSSTPSSKRTTGTESNRSASSPKGKGSQGRPSRSKTPKASHPSTSSTRGTTTGSGDIQKERSSTSRTPRKNSSTKISADGKSVSPEAKKPFVRPDRLTTKPLRDNEALQNLKDQMNAATAKAGGREVRDKPARGQFKREYRVGGRRSGKSQGLQNKKENN